MLPIKSKLELLFEELDKTIDILRCPVCGVDLNREGRALRCEEGHSFDLSRRGYANLLAVKPGGMYGRVLWEARARAVDSDWFGPLYDSVEKEIVRSAAVLDAGCGEGGLIARLSRGGNISIGADLSKEAVIMAAGRRGFLPLVADIAKLPIKDLRIDCVVNILSPANWAEFFRVLRPGGLLVKAWPTKSHLSELREALRLKAPKAEGGHLPGAGFRQIKEMRIEYAVKPEAASQDILAMTPLSWHADEPERRAFESDFKGSVTFSFLLAVYAREAL